MSTEWSNIIATSLVLGSIYGWVTARTSNKGHSTALDLLGLLALFSALGCIWWLLKISILESITFIVFTLIIAFVSNFSITQHYGKQKHVVSANLYDNANRNLDECAEKIYILSTMTAARIAKDLSLPDSDSKLWLIDLMSYSLFTTYLALEDASLQDHQLKAAIQSIAKNIANNITATGKNREKTYQVIMSALSDFTKKYGDYPKGQDADLKQGQLVYEVSVGLLHENASKKEADKLSIKYVARALLTIESSLNTRSLAQAMKEHPSYDY